MHRLLVRKDENANIYIFYKVLNLKHFFMKKHLNSVVMVLMAVGIIFSIIMTSVAMTKVNDLEKHHVEDGKEYSYVIDCMRNAEINYHGYEMTYRDAVQNYIDSVAPSSNLQAYAVIEQCRKYNVDVVFVLVQAEIESHFGTKGIGAKLNNVFNVGVFDGLSSSEVNEKYKYEYPNNSIEPYLQLLTKRYLVEGRIEADLMDNYVDVNGNRYASNPNYEIMFKAKYDYIVKNTQIDEQEDLVNFWGVRCGWL